MIHLLGITFREINNKRDVSENRKLNKQIQSYLFKDQRLDAFVKESDEDSIGRIYTLVKEVKELDPSIRIELKHKIVERFPDFKFYGEDEQETVSRGGLIVTAKSYEAKQKMLQHILDVEIPANSKEIGAALELGDLRENAEYKAAKEKQELLNTSSSRLKEELERARIFSADQVDVSKISFGTVAVLRNETTGKNEEYTILGPWESDPQTISFLTSPLRRRTSQS
jgi:transcription elongation GreA/GreB family factor